MKIQAAGVRTNASGEGSFADHVARVNEAIAKITKDGSIIVGPVQLAASPKGIYYVSLITYQTAL